MQGLQFQEEMENPEGFYFFFLNGVCILKTKEKGKPTMKSPINFNMR